MTMREPTHVADATLPFRSRRDKSGSPADDRIDTRFDELSHAIDERFDTLSRRIDDLAREFNCLGYFDDDSDLPRAA